MEAGNTVGANLPDIVCRHLKEFYRRRVECLDKLELKAILKRKNPYLFRAVGMMSVAELVESLLRA